MAAHVDEKQAKELLSFLSQSERADLKYFALDYILGLTGSDDGKQFLRNHEEFLVALLELTRDSNLKTSSDAYSSIINLSAEAVFVELLMKHDIIVPLMKYTLDPNSKLADKSATVLSNLTRTEPCCEKALKELLSASNDYIHKIVEVLCKTNHNPDAKLNHLAPFLSNLTQLRQGRELILDRKRCVIQRLLPFTQHQHSLTRRGGVVTIIKNCCFDTDYHDWLLSDDVDILPHLLLPLAGPEEFDDDEVEKLPPDLQYLDESKTREADPDIRNMLLEALLQLVATKNGRLTMRDKNVYLILRELDNWEQDKEVKSTCLKCIEVLIADEPEPGLENLKEVVIPEHIKFNDNDNGQIVVTQ